MWGLGRWGQGGQRTSGKGEWGARLAHPLRLPSLLHRLEQLPREAGEHTVRRGPPHSPAPASGKRAAASPPTAAAGPWCASAKRCSPAVPWRHVRNGGRRRPRRTVPAPAPHAAFASRLRVGPRSMDAPSSPKRSVRVFLEGGRGRRDDAGLIPRGGGERQQSDDGHGETHFSCLGSGLPERKNYDLDSKLHSAAHTPMSERIH